MELLKRTIGDLLKRNALFAKALHFLGIHFAHFTHKTLEEVCEEHNLSPQSVMRYLDQQGIANPDEAALTSMPVKLVMEYLRHSHFLFIKDKMPYIQHLINSTDPAVFDNPQVGHDLKEVFPLFMRDFIVHLYHEEDELFSYINYLLTCSKGITNAAATFYRISKENLQAHCKEHADHPHEMEGIRLLTNNYSCPPNAHLQQVVLFAELKHFDNELSSHANLENNVLFPKAMKLEQEVSTRLHQLARWN